MNISTNVELTEAERARVVGAHARYVEAQARAAEAVAAEQEEVLAYNRELRAANMAHLREQHPENMTGAASSDAATLIPPIFRYDGENDPPKVIG